MENKVIWICFEPINYPTARILYGDSDPNGDKDVYVPYVPASELENVQKELSALKAVDAVLDKVNLPDPVEGVIKIATTGNVGNLLGGIPIDVAPEEAVLDAVTKKVPIKRPKK